MSPSKKILVPAIFGPTAVGKTRVAFDVAQAVGAEIVSADSMQVYRGLPVLTDQPAAEMLAAVPHHLIATLPLEEDYSAARFARDAAAVIAAVHARGRLALLAGGTGLYMRALLGAFSFGVHDKKVGGEWERFIEERGLAAAVREIERVDPAAAAAVDTSNPRRVARALEAAGAGGSVARERERLWDSASPYNVLSFGLELPRAELYARIDARVDAMLAGGAVDEVAKAGCNSVSRTVAQAIGFQDICRYLAGGQSLEETAAAIKQKSRRYAKRQLTWMRKMPDIVRIDVAAGGASQASRQIAGRIRSAVAG